MKNRTAGLLMEVGTPYDRARLHRKGYFDDLLGRLDEVPETVKGLLSISRATVEMFEHVQRRLLDGLKHHPDGSERDGPPVLPIGDRATGPSDRPAEALAKAGGGRRTSP